MHEIRERLQPGQPAPQADELVLPFELRQRSRMRARLASGEEVALQMPRGTVLRDGDLLRTDDGRAVRVVARPERVMQASCATPLELLRVAYHLGNRHVPLQVAPGWLRLAEDPVLRKMLEGMGATVTVLDAPFEPEAGAYGQHASGVNDRASRVNDHASVMHDPAHEHDRHSHGH